MILPLALLAVLALAALLAVGAFGALAGAAWAKARAAAALQEATAARERLLALADHWIWETDAEHRLALWRPPAQHVAAWRDAPAPGTPFEAILQPAGASDAPAGSPVLRQMQAHAAVPAQRVELRLGDDAPRSWSLRAGEEAAVPPLLDRFRTEVGRVELAVQATLDHLEATGT